PLDRAGPGGRSATAPRGGVEWSTGTRRDVLLRSGRWRSWPAPHVDGFVPDLVDGERIAPADLRGGRVPRGGLPLPAPEPPGAGLRSLQPRGSGGARSRRIPPRVVPGQLPGSLSRSPDRHRSPTREHPRAAP